MSTDRSEPVISERCNPQARRTGMRPARAMRSFDDPSVEDGTELVLVVAGGYLKALDYR